MSVFYKDLVECSMLGKTLLVAYFVHTIFQYAQRCLIVHYGTLKYWLCIMGFCR